MKKIILALLLLTSTLFAQQTDKKWNKVIAFENEGKVKSASEVVTQIYKKAVSEKDEVQMIKCFFYHSKYLLVVDENAQTKILNNLKTDINRVSVPSKAILNFIYAKCLNDYYMRNDYKIRQRTNTAFIDEDFLTWTETNFKNQIDSTLKKTLENESVLTKTYLAEYEMIFDFFTSEKIKKETLFDYLLRENLTFYKQKVRQWEVVKSDFTPYTKQLLGNSGDFTKINFDFVTTENLHYVLALYQKQESYNPSKDNQLDRMQYVKNTLLESDEAFLPSLNTLQKEAKDTILVQKIRLEKALYYSKNASKETHPDYNLKSVSLLDSIISVKNRSDAYKLAIHHKDNLLSKSLNIQLQKYIYSDENTRAYIKYKNVTQVKVSFYKISQKQLWNYTNLYAKRDSLTTAFLQKKPVAAESFSIINKNDFFEYTTEVHLPILKTGSYFVHFESDSEKKDEKAFAYETITVSNLAVLASQNVSGETFQVVDRKTGKPLENVRIKSKDFNLKTNKNGIANYNRKKDNYYHNEIELSTVNDSISIRKNYLQYFDSYSANSNYDTKLKAKINFYLDRAIYRPGQTVFYKGIAVHKKKNETSVVQNTSFKIIIRDANDNEFKEFDVVTNEFGSFSGEFVLPKNGLTGNFRIEAEEPKNYENDINYDKEEDEHPFWDHVDLENSQIDFRVEEYKRPKFEVTFEPKKETFQVNQTIKVKGNAKAFAGSNISDAVVKYTVTRFTSYFRYFYNQQDQTETLATGETRTDASGKFSVDFTAIPSKNGKKEQLPVFNYRINISVTDINGETHDAETIVKVGYHDLALGATLPDKIETKNKNEISLTSTNLNGEFKAIKGEIKIYYTTPFSDKFKPRVWPVPDFENIPKEDFKRFFPYEVSGKTTDDVTPTLVYSKKIDTEKDKKVLLDFISNYKSGNYKVVFSAKDSFENDIESEDYFQITQSKDKYNTSTLFTIKQLNEDPKKDGFVSLKITSEIPELYIAVTGSYNSKVFFEKTSHLENNEDIIMIPLKKEFENYLKIGFQSVFENATFNDDLDVMLKKQEASKLEFSVETFRNKLQPGISENWSFKLKSANTTNEAEVLASMYDSSLDQFATRNWNGLGFYDYSYNGNNIKSSLGFDKTSSYLQNLNIPKKGVVLNNETIKLIWFGFDFNNTNNSLYVQREYQKQLNRKAKKPLNAKMISGNITDKANLPLPGVSVTVKGTQRSTATDFDGYYEIEAAEKEELVFSMIGFKSKTVIIKNSKTIDVVLDDDENSLKEVVVVGYGTQKKSMLTGAVTTIKSENIEEDNTVYSISEALEGRVAGIQIRGAGSIDSGSAPIYVVDGVIMNDIKNINPADIASMDVLKDASATAIYGSRAANGVIILTTKKAFEELTQVKARKNLSETAFFLPNLKTDSKGKVSFNFTSPEALTAWKLRLLAHNKDAVSGYLEKNVITQKELMVLPNFPRFFREKDTIVISAKISNITAEAKTGISVLQFFDATTMQPIDAKMLNADNIKNFTIPAYGNTTVNWKITIPEGLQGVQYKILAKSGNFSDGEENILPVLTNNMLVTESIPIWVRENSTKEYTFENLKNNTSTTLRNHQFTLEYTSNPTWIAIQSLPYLMEYEHECAEQTFARFYANALASEVISSNPKIATVFEDWRKNGKLNSKLEENEELKSIILAETPWLKDAQSEEEKKKNLALLFDLEKMKTSQEATFQKLKQKQKASGGFSWFDGSDENEYITRHILAGLGHLSKLSKGNTSQIDEISKTGIPYIDSKFLEYYKARTKNLKKADKIIWINPHFDLHYLYARSFYLEKYPLYDTLKKASKLYLETAKNNWLSYSLYEKGMTALTLNRYGEKEAAKTILESLKETSSNNEDWGMYWIANKPGWYWYQAPIETQALLIEAFAEVTNDTKSVDAMKVWLLKNKQTKNWPTTKSTTEAVYALLMEGNDWLSVKDNTVIKLGDEKIMTKKLAENEKEAATGYIKMNWKADEVKKEMASISIENKSKVPGFGGVYWQYFEDLDKIKTNSGAVLSVVKELYLKKSTLKGNELEKITSKNPLKTGDLVTVRLIISAKEDTEYVHLKDMRASCFEPVNVLSEYKYNDGLGYYMSTKDAASHFFFDQINKGTYVIEYDIRVNNSGEFSNGITTIESMYAPEFTSHTKGIRIKVN
ncbi:carboxypeptidase-like regulatory domain-containing protein [Flavobacterium gyeonganense]|uniref:Carboxypeptidase-like regulatory domain-containing protein n=1 Tax=Flavobacterium gyeonganense TaxID=1310418 RepID=A0ABV5H7S1_9FLAO|nr:carboxypeptidase-like regulatory domain-containing protein [Flavobacterium gyeonganense]